MGHYFLRFDIIVSQNDDRHFMAKRTNFFGKGDSVDIFDMQSHQDEVKTVLAIQYAYRLRTIGYVNNIRRLIHIEPAVFLLDEFK